MFASRSTKTIPVPFDPPHEVTIQQLPGRHLERASQENYIEAQAYVTRLGGAEFRKQLQEVEKDSGDVKAEIVKAKADPLNGYHKPTLIKFGLKSWTYDDPITEAAIADLTDEGEDFIARAILKLTKPSLFQTVEEAKATQKETHADTSIS
jgi:hypothetical protein